MAIIHSHRAISLYKNKRRRRLFYNTKFSELEKKLNVGPVGHYALKGGGKQRENDKFKKSDKREASNPIVL